MNGDESQFVRTVCQLPCAFIGGQWLCHCNDNAIAICHPITIDQWRDDVSREARATTGQTGLRRTTSDVRRIAAWSLQRQRLRIRRRAVEQQRSEESPQLQGGTARRVTQRASNRQLRGRSFHSAGDGPQVEHICKVCAFPCGQVDGVWKCRCNEEDGKRGMRNLCRPAPSQQWQDKMTTKESEFGHSAYLAHQRLCTSQTLEWNLARQSLRFQETTRPVPFASYALWMRNQTPHCL